MISRMQFSRSNLNSAKYGVSEGSDAIVSQNAPIIDPSSDLDGGEYIESTYTNLPGWGVATGHITEDDIFEEFPEFYWDRAQFEDVPYALIDELAAKDKEMRENKGPKAMDAHLADRQAAVEKWRKHDADVGSAEVQVAISNCRIKYLSEHLLRNRKDQHTKRGLIALVNQRKRFLNYLYKTNPSKADEMVKELGIRHNVYKEDNKYNAFKNTKSKKKTTHVKRSK